MSGRTSPRIDFARQQAIFVRSVSDEIKPPGALKFASSSETQNMERGAPNLEQPPTGNIPYYVGATAALALSGSLLYKMRNKNEEIIIEEEGEAVVDTPKQSNQRLRGDADYRFEGIDASKSQLKIVHLGAKLIEEVYSTRRKGQSANVFKPIKDTITGDNRKSYNVPDDKFLGLDRHDMGNDLSQGFSNDNTFYFAIRGLDIVNDARDFVEGIAMGVESVQTDNPDDFGSIFDNDVKILEKSLLDAIRKYPNKKFVILGHSRGGAVSLQLGRKFNLETHSFNAASKRGEFYRDYEGYDTSNINIYTTNRDLVPAHLRNTASYSPETHINIITANQDMLFEHGISHFTSSDGWLSLRVKENPSNEYDFDGPEFEFIQDTTAIIDEPFIKEEIQFTKNVFNNVPFVPNNKIVEPKIVEPKISTNKLDADNDGFITYREFKSYWKSKGLTDKRIDELFNSLDKDNNRVLDSNEY